MPEFTIFLWLLATPNEHFQMRLKVRFEALKNVKFLIIVLKDHIWTM